MFKKTILLTLVLSLLVLAGCGGAEKEYEEVAATTLPVYEFTSRLCQDTGITVTRLVTEQISCLHDYSLNVNQVRAAEAAKTIVISGAGLEDFMNDILSGHDTIDASAGIQLLEGGHTAHHHEEEGHHHEHDGHIWLSPVNAAAMAKNICAGLEARHPEQRDTLRKNLDALLADLQALEDYGQEQLRELSCRKLITFHDGFTYLARDFGLEILRAVEEESGSEASAQDIDELIGLVKDNHIPAIFTERNGSDSAASVICRETGVSSFVLDMAMAGDSYFDSMYHNIDTLKEALG